MKKSGSGKPSAPPAPQKPEEAEAPRFRAAALSHRKPGRFHWRAAASARAALAEELGLSGIASLSFKGEILPEGRADFRLEALLEAEITQPCVITLAPVPARISEAVTRRYLAQWQDPEGEEVEMPEDDTAEALPEVIDIADVVAEALSLALPPWPRSEGAELGEQVFTEEGSAPLRDEDLRPFAGLASLLKKGDKPAGEPGSQQ